MLKTLNDSMYLHVAVSGIPNQEFRGHQMFIKIIAIIVIGFFSHSIHALSLSIPKSIVDNSISKKFPKEKLSITLDKPTTKFIKDSQRIELCGIWLSKISQHKGEFSINTQLIWNKSKGNVEISKVNILKITLGEEKELSNALAATLNTTLLTLFDGTSIYQAPEIIGKNLEGIEITENSLRLKF